MRDRPIPAVLRGLVLPVLLAMTPSCDGAPGPDAEGREIPWTYGPTTGTARPEHLAATGTKGPGAISRGWKCRLVEGRRLTVRPYQLSTSHTLFGKVVLIVGLFDKTGKQIDSVRSAAITAGNATFSFDLAESVGKELHDLVLWFGEP